MIKKSMLYPPYDHMQDKTIKSKGRMESASFLKWIDGDCHMLERLTHPVEAGPWSQRHEYGRTVIPAPGITSRHGSLDQGSSS